MSDRTTHAVYSTSTSTMLVLIFMVLKLTDNINWPWIYVFLPWLIPLGIIVAMLLFAGICLCCVCIMNDGTLLPPCHTTAMEVGSPNVGPLVYQQV